MGEVLMLSYAALGLIVIIFMILGLHMAALATFGIMILGALIILAINWTIRIKKIIKKMKK